MLIYFNVKARSLYRMNFVISLLQSFVVSGSQLMMVWIVLDRFKDINGWNIYEIGFMMAISRISMAASIVFFVQIWTMDSIINQGELDRILVRPKSSFFLFVFQGFNIQGIGDFIAGILILVVTAQKVSVVWSAWNIAYLLFVILCCCAVFCGILLVLALTSFWFLSFRSLRDFIIVVFGAINPYPISIYGKAVQYILTFIVPIGFVYYYPSLHFFNRGDLVFSNWIIYASPLILILLSGICLLLWKLGLRAYKSSGT